MGGRRGGFVVSRCDGVMARRGEMAVVVVVVMGKGRRRWRLHR